MRVPLSWLRDFAPFPVDDPAALAADLDDLGLVVEAVERVGEGLDDVVVARVDEIAAIPGADRIRLATVEAGGGPLEVVCGADNYAVGDLVPLAPVGAVLPGGFEIGRRTMKGVVSNGMLCSGRELALSEDHQGLLLLTEVEGARPGLPVVELLGVTPDVVFDVTVEGNRPDAWSVAGVARDLAARLHLPFALPDPAPVAGSGTPVEKLATLVVEDDDLCPRIVVRVLEGVVVGPSPRWLARRLVLAGMRPINNVVDASNYVMLELGQPTHPYDLDRLGAPGLEVRRARPGETLTTLDGVTRTLGATGRGLGDTGEDCIICDAQGTPVGIAGVMGGASSEIAVSTTRVLLEAAHFAPLAIARTSKRLGLRTEASARFERGCDPWGIDRAVARFCELVGARVATGELEARARAVPRPFDLEFPVERVRSVLGVPFAPAELADLLEPIGFATTEDAPGSLRVTVPTNRPDVRPAPHGVADVVEEVARTYGYARLPRRQPSWPEPGALSDRQRTRRRVADVLCGVGAVEVWTPTLVDDADHATMGLSGPAVAVANPLASEEAWLRRSMLPGLLRALAYNANRRQGSVRLFEVGTVFSHPDEAGRPGVRSGAGGTGTTVLPGERELVTAALAFNEDDARTAVAAWRVLAETVSLDGVRLEAAGDMPGLHPTRSARLVAARGTPLVLGAAGEVDPDVAAAFGLAGRRIGWLEVDLGRLLDAPRRSRTAAAVSRFPSSDVDLALVVDDAVPADRVGQVLAEAGGDLVESVILFDVYRGPGVADGARSLAFRLRFVAPDRTLTDDEVGRLRQAAIDGAAQTFGARLR